MGRYDDLAVPGIEPGAPPAVDPSLWPVDLTAVVVGNYTQPIPTILRRDDGQSLIYSGEVNGIHGPSGEGKGWIELWAAVEQMRAGHTVMLLDLEDNAPSVVARLRLLGATDNDILQRLIYIRPTVGLTGLVEIEHLILVVEEHRPSLVIVDSLGEAFGLDGIDEDRDAEVGPWLRRIARRLADAGPAVWLTDHSTKANDNPLFPSGSKRKRAAITGASYLVTATQPPSAGHGGRLRLTCAKDRHGSYKRSEAVADFVMTPTQADQIAVRLWTPDIDAESSPVIELAIRAAVKAAHDEGGAVSQNTLLGMMQIRCRTEIKRAAIDLAVKRGVLTESDGPRKARMFTATEDTDQ